MRRTTRMILLILSLVLNLSVPAFAGSGQGGAEAIAPKVTVKVNQVTDDDTLEVSLQADGAGSGRILSVAAVLRYDTERLTLIGWDASKTPVALSTEPAAPVSGQTMAPGNVAGKPSLAFRAAAGEGGAEETEKSAAYVYVAAQGHNGNDLTAGKELATIRFRIQGPAGEAADFTDALSLAELTEFQPQFPMAAAPAAMNVSGRYYRSDWTADGAGMENYARLTVEAGEIASPTRGPSLYGGGGSGGPADSSAFASLTFYDWDDTLLGTRIVAKGASLKDPNSEETDNDGNGIPDKKDYETLLASAAPEQIGENGHLLDSVLEENGFAPVAPEGNLLVSPVTDQNGEPISAVNKEGYLYAGWVDYATGRSTPDSRLTDNTNNVAKQTGLVDLASVSASQTVKAAYNEDASKIGVSATGAQNNTAAKRYQVYYSPFVRTSAGYVTTFTVKRSGSTRRANDGETYLQIGLQYLGFQSSTLRVVPGVKDIETFELTLPLNAAATFNTDRAVAYQIFGGSSAGVEARTNTAYIKAIAVQ
ncbi:hypothetical protein [Bacilliculturomica massiliensis]|uniref:hypothetical protein n=1 Tax=Bacilliculturomica massiliensis TaxID=1917867 RepID=UPI0010321E68|nr:hypothetical protein [Bacilliculturomica massiliensis]